MYFDLFKKNNTYIRIKYFIRQYYWFFIFIIAYEFLFTVPRIWGFDEAFYYGQMTSLFYDGDFLLHNDLLMNWNSAGEKYTSLTQDVVNGALFVSFPVGKAIIEGIYSFPAILLSKLFGLPRYNYLLLFFLHAGAILQGLLLFLFCRKTLKLLHYNNFCIGFSIALVFVGTPLSLYSTQGIFMSHLCSALSAALFIYFSTKLVNDMKKKDLFLTGIFLGFTALVRWQDILLGIYPLIIFIYFLLSGKKSFINLLKSGLIILIPCMVITSLQNFVWLKIFGEFFKVPQTNRGIDFFRFTSPFLKEFLFSAYHGLVPWAPIYFFSIIGLFLLALKKETRIIGIAGLVCILSEIYINSIIADWHGSASYGPRRMVSLTAISVIGTAEILKKLGKKVVIIFSLFILFWAYFCYVNFAIGRDDLSYFFLKRPAKENPIVYNEQHKHLIKDYSEKTRAKVREYFFHPKRFYRPGYVVGNSYDRNNLLNKYLRFLLLASLYIVFFKSIKKITKLKNVQNFLIAILLIYFCLVYLFVVFRVPENTEVNKAYDIFLKNPLDESKTEIFSKIPYPTVEFIQGIEYIKIGEIQKAREKLSNIDTVNYKNLSFKKINEYAFPIFLNSQKKN